MTAEDCLSHWKWEEQITGSASWMSTSHLIWNNSVICCFYSRWYCSESWGVCVRVFICLNANVGVSSPHPLGNFHTPQSRKHRDRTFGRRWHRRFLSWPWWRLHSSPRTHTEDGHYKRRHSAVESCGHKVQHWGKNVGKSVSSSQVT